MSMMRKQFLQSYQTALDVEVGAASPHKLVLMLFDGAIQAIRQARIHIGNGNIAEKGRLIGKAIAIVDEGLRSCLSTEAGGELAANLEDLYEYCTLRLLEANLHNNLPYLQEVEGLLGELRSAWAEISPQQAMMEGTAPPARQGMNYGAA